MSDIVTSVPPHRGKTWAWIIARPPSGFAETFAQYIMEVQDTRRTGEIGQDIDRRMPTSGDAFAITVMGKPHTERKDAGRALMKEILTLVQLQSQVEVHIASIGGFDLVYDGEHFGRGDNYHYQTLLQRTGADYEIDLVVTVTSHGAISRIEHARRSGNIITRGWRTTSAAFPATSRGWVAPSRSLAN